MSSQKKNRVFMLRKAEKQRVGNGTKPVRFRPYAKDRYLPWHKTEHPNMHPRVEEIFRSHLVPFFGTRRLSDIDTATVGEYQFYRQDEAMPDTVTEEVQELRASLDQAVEWNLLARNASLAVTAVEGQEEGQEEVGEIHFYTAEQLDALYTYCRQASQPPGGEVLCWAAFWRLLANTGLRRREALQLKWADITPDQLGVRANRGDRIRARVVPISQGAREAILEIRKRTGNTPFVFPRITGPELSGHFALQARESGIGGTLAWLRHSFIAHLVMQGLTLTSVQQLAGHSSFATTERYAYLGPTSAINGLDDLSL